MGYFMKDNDYETIVTGRLVLSKTPEAIAQEIGCGVTSVNNTLTIFNAVKEGDWNRCVALVENQTLPIAPFIWSAKKLGLELPAAVTDAYEMRSKRKAKAKEQTTEEKPQAVQTTEAKNDALFFAKILEALNKQNELLEQLLDTVLPHWFNDLKDDINANTDVVCERIRSVEKIAETIKQNTRRRGS